MARLTALSLLALIVGAHALTIHKHVLRPDLEEEVDAKPKDVGMRGIGGALAGAAAGALVSHLAAGKANATSVGGGALLGGMVGVGSSLLGGGDKKDEAANQNEDTDTDGGEDKQDKQDDEDDGQKSKAAAHQDGDNDGNDNGGNDEGGDKQDDDNGGNDEGGDKQDGSNDEGGDDTDSKPDHVVAHHAIAHAEANNEAGEDVEANNEAGEDDDMDMPQSVCEARFVEDTRLCRGMTGDRRVVGEYADVFGSEMKTISAAFRSQKARVAMLYAGLGASSAANGGKVNRIVRSAIKSTKATLAFRCRAEGSPCQDEAVPVRTLSSALGGNPMCPYDLALGKNQAMLDGGMVGRWAQLVDSFRDTDEELFFGKSRFIGAAVVVCARVASMGEGGPRFALDTNDAQLVINSYKPAIAKAVKEKDAMQTHYDSVVKGKGASLEEDEEGWTFRVVVEDDWNQIPDIAVMEDVVSMAHNADFAHQGNWIGWWFCSVANFFYELEDFDEGAVNLLTMVDPKFGGAMGYSDESTESALLNWWWHFEIGLLVDGSESVAQLLQLDDATHFRWDRLKQAGGFPMSGSPSNSEWLIAVKAKFAELPNKQLSDLIADDAFAAQASITFDQLLSSKIDTGIVVGRRQWNHMFFLSGETRRSDPTDVLFMPRFAENHDIDMAAIRHARAHNADPMKYKKAADAEFLAKYCVLHTDDGGEKRYLPKATNFAGKAMLQKFPRDYGPLIAKMHYVNSAGAVKQATNLLPQGAALNMPRLAHAIEVFERNFADNQHGFQYHDLTHVLLFSHALGRQWEARAMNEQFVMGAMTDDDLDIVNIHEALRIAGLYHDVGYAVLAADKEAHTNYLRDGGSFGAMHEFVSLFVVLNVVWHYGTTEKAIPFTFTERMAMAYAILATKIEFSMVTFTLQHLSKAKIDEVLDFMYTTGHVHGSVRAMYSKSESTKVKKYLHAHAKAALQMVFWPPTFEGELDVDAEISELE